MSDELDGPLRTSVEAMRDITVPADSLQRAVNRAKQIDHPVDGVRNSDLRPSTVKSSTGHPWRWFAAAAAVLSAVMVLGLVFAPAKSLGWADMSQAMQSQRWIRLQNGKDGEIWVSPEQKVWAFKVNKDWIMFGDETQRTKYEFRSDRYSLTKSSGGGTIIKTSLGEETVARMLPLNDLSGNDAAIQPWIRGTTRITDQKRREVTEAGKLWIEFELKFAPPVGPRYRGKLRVDPKTGLPVSLLEESDPDAGVVQERVEHNWKFDYPARGPADIYELGVSRDLPIVDRMLSKDVLRVLDAMAASRARIGDFRLIVYQSDAGAKRWRSFPYVIWRKGERWRVDELMRDFRPGDESTPEDRRPVGAFGPAAGQDWDEWLEARLKRTAPRFLCDGKTVYRNSVRTGEWDSANAAPQDLLSGDRNARSLFVGRFQIVREVYPDLAVPQGWTLELDPHPADAEGCILIRISVEIAGGERRAHEWYYLDPAKGHAVVRTEMFTLPVGEKPDLLPTNRQTTRMEDFHQSPSGFWYPTAIREDGAGDDTTRYRFDFASELPDSLFVIKMPE